MWYIFYLIDGDVRRIVFFLILIFLGMRYNRRNLYFVDNLVFIYFNLFFLKKKELVNFLMWNFWKNIFLLGLKKRDYKIKFL